MTPKKCKELIPGHAKTHSIPADHMEIMVNAFYKSIRQKASAMDVCCNLRIRGLGDLRVSFKKVKAAYYHYLNIKCEHEPGTYQYDAAKDRMESAMKMIRLIEEEYRRKRIANNRKQAYRLKKNFTK